MVRRAETAIFLIIFALTAMGCASSGDKAVAPSARVESAVIESSYETAWHAVREALLESGYDIYTRDKRGLYIAYSGAKRRLIVPHRYRMTVRLDGLSERETRVTVESVRQRYRVTLLTHAGWEDASRASEVDHVGPLLELIRAKAGMAEDGVGRNTT